MTYDLDLAGMTLGAAFAVWLAPVLLAAVVTAISDALRAPRPRTTEALAPPLDAESSQA